MPTRQRKMFKKISKGLTILAMLLLTTNLIVFAQEETPAPSVEYYIVETEVLEDGTIIDKNMINGPPEPPPGFDRVSVELPEPHIVAGLVTLTVPAYNWSFGCTATSAAMISAYYDRTDYPDMYTGPTNGGVMPMNNSVWPDWEDSYGDMRHQCPLSATHNGLDGRLVNGHVDDYWWGYGDSNDDPFIGNWTEHTYGDCTGDYMKTNQSTYDNSDGSTTLWYYTDGSPTYCSDLISSGIDNDGGCGHKDFYESRGYTVTETYNQYIDTQGLTYGFTYDQYKAEIDAGRPVMIHVTGHTMVGVGYDDSTSNLMYINDTWDYLTHTMVWGGSYSGMTHYAVTIVQLAPAATPYGDELAVDFGASGLWHYDGTTWTRKSNWDPDDALAGWAGGLGVDFSANGLWNYDGTTWTRKSNWDPEDLEGCFGGLFSDFDGSGLWFYDGTTWTKKSNWDPAGMGCWAGGLAVDFDGSGLWNYDGTTWTRKSNWNPGSGGLAGWLDGLAVDFDANGLWNYDGAAWTRKSNWDPEDVEGWSGGLAADFGANGLWNYDGTTWSRKSNWNPEGMSALADGLAVDFGANGLWNYDGTTWTRKSTWNPENMDDCDLY